MSITTSDLFSSTTITRLVAEPLFSTSVALSTLTRLPIGTTSVSLPSVKAGAAGFVGELDPLTDANVDAEMVRVEPKKVSALQIVSSESARDAAAAPLIGRALVAGLANEIDSALFGQAAGGQAPSGLPGMVGHGSINADPGNLSDFDVIAQAIAEVEDEGGTANTVFCSPATWEVWSTLKTASGSTQPVLHGPGGMGDATTRSVYGLRVVVSRHVPDADAWVIDSTRVLAVVRQDVELAQSTHSHFGTDGVAVRAIARVEFAAPDPEVIVRIASTSS